MAIHYPLMTSDEALFFLVVLLVFSAAGIIAMNWKGKGSL